MRGLFPNILAGIIFMAAVAAGVIFFVIPSANFWKIVLGRYLAPYDVKVESVAFDRWRYRQYPLDFVHGLRLELVRQGKPWKLRASGLQVRTGSRGEFSLFVRGLEFNDGAHRCSDGDLRFNQTGARGWNSQFSARQCVSQGFVFTDILAGAQGDKDVFALPGVRAGFYGGRVAGNFRLDKQEPFSYIINISLENVNLVQMASVNEAVFGQVSGSLQGELSVRGRGGRLDGIDGRFNIPQDGAVRAFLLKNLVDYLPARSQRAEFDKLVAIGGMVPLDRAEARVKSIDERSLSLGFDLESRRYNIRPQVTVDINFDGNYQDLFRFFKSFSFKEPADAQ
jgi:hypothetical protein